MHEENTNPTLKQNAAGNSLPEGEIQTVIDTDGEEAVDRNHMGFLDE